MDLKEIVSIAGQPGLFKYVAQSSHGIIIESLQDGRRSSVGGNQRVSSLGEIALFTEADDLPLVQVFYRMAQKCDYKETISHKSDPSELKAFFEAVIPEFDRDNVKASDMKKIVSWYNLLANSGLLPTDADMKSAEASDVSEE